MVAQRQTYVTQQEYLALERVAKFKSEYVNGEIFAMAGASEEHNTIAANTLIEIGSQLKRRPCKAYGSDLRVKVSPTGLYTYPDVTVVCGKPQIEHEQGLDTLLNPIVLVEVLSPTTADYDRGAKFEHYRKLASLQEYVLVAQDKPHIAHYVRQADHTWVFSETYDVNASVHLPSITCDLALADVYAKVEFETEA